MSDRRIRVLIGKPGLDGHDRGAKTVASVLRDHGMEVIYTGLRQSPESIARAALQEDVDVVGLSILSGAHLPLCRKIREALEAAGVRQDIVWVVGGNVPAGDRPALEELGVSAVFSTGSDFADMVRHIREEVAA